VAFKIDFEKAFDKVNHSFILAFLEAKGFGPVWCSWIRQILASATSSVLLNGIPGSFFQCKRGVRQGDPLSPLLFVLAADLLQSILNKAMAQGIIDRPIPCTTCPDFPIVQYADDTLVIMKADARNLICLKAHVQTFAESTGLRVNYNKSNRIPINFIEERFNHFSATINCKKGSLPFTYLGLPLCIVKPSIEHILPIVQRTQARLGEIADFLNYGGKLQLVNLCFLP
jgi:hypothetical protein